MKYNIPATFTVMFLMIIFGCKKDDSSTNLKEDDKFGTLDYNGFKYKTITIGSQEWTVENLRTTTYNDNSPIPNVTNENDWVSDNTGAYCTYGNTSSNLTTYGCLYNWIAVNTGKLAPLNGGWRVPSDADWTKLSGSVGSTDGTKLKSKIGWNDFNGASGNGSDEYGFSAFPGGLRGRINGIFGDLGNYGYWWSTTDIDDTFAWIRSLDYSDTNVIRRSGGKGSGFSIRLVRDK